MITTKTIRRLGLVLLAPAALLLAAILPAAAQAAAPAPGWALVAEALPTHLTPNASGTLDVEVFNTGEAGSSGTVEVTDTLPPGFTATEAGELIERELPATPFIKHELWECTIAPGSEANSVVSCVNTAKMPSLAGGGGLPTNGQGPNYLPEIGIAFQAAAAEGTAANRVTIEGGGAPTPAATSNPITVGSTPPGFSLIGWDGWFSNADGTVDTQAGSHPYEVTFSFDLAGQLEESGALESAGGEPRDIEVPLPPGFVGNPQAVPQCTHQQLLGQACPAGSLIGTLNAKLNFASVPPELVWNMVPPPGVAAEFGINISGITTLLDASVRAGGDYGVTTKVPNTPQRGLHGSVLTIWGVPYDPSHLIWRNAAKGGCAPSQIEHPEHPNQCTQPEGEAKPFLTLPTSCQGPQPFSISANTWLDPNLTAEATFLSHLTAGEPEGFTGCNALDFTPTIEAKPTTNVADSPTGLKVDVHFPQQGLVDEPEGRSQADLKNTVVTLPKGLAINPASANGLGACSEAQIGYIGKEAGLNTDRYTPDPANCPDAAKIGTVEVDTPLLDHPLPGSVYVAKPQENPFGSLLAIYIAVNDPISGVVVKLAGEVKADPVTGQLTTTVASPQQPFEDFKFEFFAGPHAALRTPTTCGGSLTTTTDMTPWSAPEGADAFPTDSFEITQSPSGGSCPTSEAALPNKLTYNAGTITPKAGIYSPAVAHLARPDGSQQIKLVDGTLPEGLLAKLAGVSECSDAQIAAARTREHIGGGHEEIASPSCPLGSEVGVLHVGAGAGPDPYYVTGRVYLAGPYKGAPLSGLAIVPAVAGPYDLGVVVNRAPIYINPETGQAHIVTDEIPQIIDGIPLDGRSIDLNVNRPNFTLNPTSCEKKAFTLSAPAALSVPFQVGECQKLGFAPKLAINLKGGTKRHTFPSLKAVVTYPKGAYANIAKASVALPHSEFLEQGHIGTICTRVQFAEGAVPGEKCPKASIYGFARATTPLLDKAVEGPVYLRSSSHNLPDLVAALNGQINVDLAGRIDTDKEDGIRNTFDVVPDAPVSKFVLEMKGGSKGLLVNSENICRKPQRATARFTAQNGKTDNYRPLIGNSCGGKGRKGHKKH